ncbi:MAG TPA: dTMP kinase [Desulfurivibrionaceae bacterium]|nr:dTMP kinase [Desulfurivibrionaceae bacterium]
MDDMKQRGLLIAFEGIDGTGKSSQIIMLAATLEQMGYQVVITREPTDGRYGRRIRSLFSNRARFTPAKELELFMADRREHVREVIEPALCSGRIVLTDRYYLSTAAYQGAAGQDPEAIIAANETFAPVPDLVVLLTLTPAQSIHRIRTLRGEALNDFEQEETLIRVAAIFAGIDRDYITRIDAAGSLAEVRDRVEARVRRLLVEKLAGGLAPRKEKKG